MKKTLSERFFEKVLITESCWLWQAGKDGAGYGMIRDENGRYMGAHRASWELHNRPLKSGEWVLHRCDVHACVNPLHLFVGNQFDNMQDMHAKGRAGYTGHTGTLNHKAKVSEYEVRLIRALYKLGQTQSAIASQFGITQAVVSKIVLRRTWKHIA